MNKILKINEKPINTHSIDWVVQNQIDEFIDILNVYKKFKSECKIEDYGNGPAVGYNQDYGNTYIVLDTYFEHKKCKNEKLVWSLSIVKSDFSNDIYFNSQDDYFGNEVQIIFDETRHNKIDDIIADLKIDIDNEL